MGDQYCRRDIHRMEFQRGTTRIYACPICQVDTPHTVAGHHGSTYGIQCSHCRGGSLVNGSLLDVYQKRWEAELLEILEGLGELDDD